MCGTYRSWCEVAELFFADFSFLLSQSINIPDSEGALPEPAGWEKYLNKGDISKCVS